MAFALVSALEAQYEIDHNRPNRNLNLSEAFVDYEVYDWKNANLTSVFQNNFAIPEEGAGNFATRCPNEQNCPLLGDVRACINNGQCFVIQDIYNETTHEWEQQVQCTPCPPGIKKARGTNVVKVNSGISRVDDFKSKLIFEGPMILKLNGHSVVNELYNYNATSSLTYHAVTVIGWEDVAGGTKLHFKDSWPGSATAFKYSKVITDTRLETLIDNGENSPGTGFELFQVRNAHVVGERVPYINFSYFSPADQCPPPVLNPPVVQHIFIDGPVIHRNIQHMAYATVNCNGEPAVDWQWSIVSSASNSPIENGCNSRIRFTTYTQGNSLQIKVRAKAANGLWSPWKTRTFTVDDNLN